MANIVRFSDPFAGLTSLHSQLDDIFNNFLTPSLGGNQQGIPAMDVYTEDDKRLVADIHAPGFTPEEIDVSMNNGVLEIRGEKHTKEEDKDKKRDYMIRESHASFYRSIMLPKHADADNIQADFHDGVLKVVVPFKELPQPKRIQISSGNKK